MKLQLITEITWDYSFILLLLIIGSIVSFINFLVIKNGIKKYFLTIILVVLFLTQIYEQTLFPGVINTKLLVYLFILFSSNIIVAYLYKRLITGETIDEK